MKTKKIKRLFRGLASLRDYEREKFIQQGGVILDTTEGKMTITPEQLQDNMFQISPRKFQSRYGTMAYSMWDIRFKADD